MTFADDLAALPHAAQIALVQAVAREHGDDLDEDEAEAALELYAALSAGQDAARTRTTDTLTGARRDLEARH